MARKTKISYDTYRQWIAEANEIAVKAAEEWLAKATARGPKYSVHSADLFGNKGPAIDYLLDVCGNAHVRCKDKRSRFARFLMEEYGDKYTITVPIHNEYRRRQEWGLASAQADAVCDFLRSKGIDKIYVWSYID